MRAKNQQGIVHIGLIIGLLIFVGVVALIAWRWWSTQQTGGSSDSSAVQQAVANAKCDVGDKDICKFYTSWKASANYKVTSTDTREGQTATSTFESTDSGKRFHMVTTMDGKPYETIHIDNVIYTRDANGKWWKQTVDTSKVDQYKSSDYKYDFSNPEDTTTTATKTTYKLIGQEACGNLTCFKYQVTDPSATDQTQYIWFDNHNYQLRRMRTESKDGSVSDQTFSYTGVTINAPASATELLPSQVVNPLTGEVTTIPSQSDIDAMQ
jgi:hypothetical protein